MKGMRCLEEVRDEERKMHGLKRNETKRETETKRGEGIENRVRREKGGSCPDVGKSERGQEEKDEHKADEKGSEERKKRRVEPRWSFYFISLVSKTNPLALNSVTTHVGVLGVGIIPAPFRLLLLDDVADPPEVMDETEGVRECRPPKTKPPRMPAEGARVRFEGPAASGGGIGSDGTAEEEEEEEEKRDLTSREKVFRWRSFLCFGEWREPNPPPPSPPPRVPKT